MLAGNNTNTGPSFGAAPLISRAHGRGGAAHLLSSAQTRTAKTVRARAERSHAMTREQMARITLRYDTSMSRAMLRALGIEAPEPVRFGTVASVDRYEGIGELMNQRFGVRP